MRIPACKNPLKPAIGFIFTAILLLFISPISVRNYAHAEQINTKQYLQPNFSPEVPVNQYTYIQSIIIDTIASVHCIITGIDPYNPEAGCLDYNAQSGKLAMSPPDKNSSEIGGLLSLAPAMFSFIYSPPVSSTNYFRYLASNFGIVQPAQAQSYNGFESLEPLAPMWVSVRNIAYFVFVVIFIIIGLGIMLRIKIDPRTVMTLQNQIPKIIISILLVTFSYAIVGLMIDAMWLATYAGINIITDSNPQISNFAGCTTDTDGTRTNTLGGPNLQQRTGESLRGTPFTAFDNILEGESYGFLDEKGCYGGIIATTQSVSNIIGNIVKETIQGMVEGGIRGELDPAKKDGCDLSRIFSGSFSSCLKEYTGFSPGAMIGGMLGWLATIISKIIVFCVIIWSLIRIWFALLKAYIMIILYTITGPLWIIMGLLPSKPLGFEKWFRRIFANLAVFPATVLLFVIAAVFTNSLTFYNSNDQAFNPPMIGNPNVSYFGYIIAFGILLIAPGLLDIIRSSLGAVGKQGTLGTQSITNMVAAGSSFPKGVGGTVWNRTMGVNRFGQAAPMLSYLTSRQGRIGKHFSKLIAWGAGVKKETK